MCRLVTSILLALASVVPAAQAVTYSELWGDATVTITYPEQVTYDTAFAVSFSVDSAGMTSSDAIAFLSEMTISNTVNLGSATWNYDMYSLNPAYATTASGNINDAYTAVNSTGDGYRIAFSDVIYPDWGYTWLWGTVGTDTFNDKVTWTVANMIIQADTTISIRLDDQYIVNGPAEFGVTVIDPPATIASVPEPSVFAMMLLGLAALAGLGRRQRMPRPAFGPSLA